MPKPRVFKVEITSTATYFIKDEEGFMNEDGAAELACGWFAEREPEVYCEELEASSIPAVDAYC